MIVIHIPLWELSQPQDLQGRRPFLGACPQELWLCTQSSVWTPGIFWENRRWLNKLHLRSSNQRAAQHSQMSFSSPRRCFWVLCHLYRSGTKLENKLWINLLSLAWDILNQHENLLQRCRVCGEKDLFSVPLSLMQTLRPLGERSALLGRARRERCADATLSPPAASFREACLPAFQQWRDVWGENTSCYYLQL